MTTTVAMPQLGESVVEGTIGKWLVQEGEHVQRDQPIVEILTDKADSEVPSPVSGVVVKLLAREDDVVRVGAGLFVIDEAGQAAAKAAEPKKAEAAAPTTRATPEIPPPPQEPARAAEPKPAARQEPARAGNNNGP